jgi:hypothetical protein
VQAKQALQLCALEIDRENEQGCDDDAVDPVHVQYGDLRDERATSHQQQQDGTQGGDTRRQDRQPADQLQRARGIAEPLAQPDDTKLLDHSGIPAQLHAREEQEGQTEDDAENPDAEALSPA